MKNLSNIAVAAGLAVLLGTPAFAVANPYQYQRVQTSNVNGRITTQGHITQMAREGDMYRITLDNGGFSYFVPVTMARDRDLRVGDMVSLSGYPSSNGITVDLATPVNHPYYGTVAGPMSAIVLSTNRHYNYLSVRDEATGRRFKVDVRSMDTRRSVNVWRLRPGDRIVVSGNWENRNTFDATTVSF